jgi:hypothetical protein
MLDGIVVGGEIQFGHTVGDDGGNVQVDHGEKVLGGTSYGAVGEYVVVGMKVVGTNVGMLVVGIMAKQCETIVGLGTAVDGIHTHVSVGVKVGAGVIYTPVGILEDGTMLTQC